MTPSIDRAGFALPWNHQGARVYRSSSYSRRCGQVILVRCECQFPLAKDEWRTNVSRSPQTAHQLASARIYYRFHPFYDCEIEIVRRQRADNSAVMIRVIDSDLNISVPAWMLDQSVCSSMAIDGIARIALSSLRDLRESVDLQLAAISATNKGSRIASGEPDGQAPPPMPPADV